jgi:hypothetical protein
MTLTLHGLVYYLIKYLLFYLLYFLAVLGFKLARQALYHLSHVPTPFSFNYILNRISQFCPGLRSFYLHFSNSWDDKHSPLCPAYWLRWCLANFYLGSTSNHGLLNLYLPSSLDYKCEPLHLALLSVIFSWKDWLYIFGKNTTERRHHSTSSYGVHIDMAYLDLLDSKNIFSIYPFFEARSDGVCFLVLFPLLQKYLSF